MPPKQFHIQDSISVVTTLDETAPLAAAVFDESMHELIPCGGFTCLTEFEQFLKQDLYSRRLRRGELTCHAEGIAAVCGLNDEGQSMRRYLLVTTQQLPYDWRERTSVKDPPVAAFGLEREEDCSPKGAFVVGAFLSTAELARNREFAESSIKNFDGRSTFALTVPFRLA